MYASPPPYAVAPAPYGTVAYQPQVMPVPMQPAMPAAQPINIQFQNIAPAPPPPQTNIQIVTAPVVSQPQPTNSVADQIVINPVLGDKPCLAKCQYCRKQAVTNVTYTTGGFAWLICVLLFLFGGSLGCCLIPFCVNSCKDAHHQCSQCSAEIYVHKRL
ncbi:cell death-inducing p53-target protein 1 homolog [Polypterus senegalus]|uniref:cell death-inducing p53-target protein 1 homolog n=1 Tax=Polypterus senegalus TaxID=55291 RepID=UPI00196276FB|nr:cell death-inducing p53-target protein 1 homolog [Polypterus senegalus]